MAASGIFGVKEDMGFYGQGACSIGGRLTYTLGQFCEEYSNDQPILTFHGGSNGSSTESLFQFAAHRCPHVAADDDVPSLIHAERGPKSEL